MNKVTHYLTLDLAKPESQMNILSFSAVNGDNAHRIQIALMCDGAKYDLNNCTAVWMSRKPNGSVVYNLCSIDDNQVIYDLTNADTGAVGLAQAEIRLYENAIDTVPLTYDPDELYVVGDMCIYEDKFYKCIAATTGDWEARSWEEQDMTLLISPRFSVNIIASVGDETAVISSSEFTALTQAMAALGQRGYPNLIPMDDELVTVDVLSNADGHGTVARKLNLYSAMGYAGNTNKLTVISKPFRVPAGDHRLTLLGYNGESNAPIISIAKVNDQLWDMHPASNVLTFSLESEAWMELHISDRTHGGAKQNYAIAFYPILD